jgi:HlyD family secretion protein
MQLATLQSNSKRLKGKVRFTNLVKANAAPAKQLDDINAQIDQLKKQIEAQKSTLSISTDSYSKEAIPLEVQIEQIEDQLKRCRIINPVQGTVLLKYATVNEMTAPGKPLYKIATCQHILRAYITGDRCPHQTQSNCNGVDG